MTFAVIDFETTGLMPERSDRVIEVGVVLADDSGNIEHEWTTLVNPRRDVGASHVHGLRAADLMQAPEFRDVSDHVLSLTAGRAVVAHNATFDMRFLHAELQRAGYPVTDRPAAVCSMKWAGRLVGPAKLEHCCAALGIELTQAHSALADARATAQLVGHLLALQASWEEWDREVRSSRSYRWPPASGATSTVPPVRRGERSVDPHAWLDKVLRAAWIPGAPEDEASYLLVLDRALLDRSISLTEGEQLAETARAAGLTPATIQRLHRSYLESVAAEALADGVVTDGERDDLASVASALGMTSSDVETALATARGSAEAASPESRGNRLAAGDRIVFTGQMERGRDEWVAEIVAAGLSTGAVSKSTRLLVAADPDSMSGKAAKARTYGVPVVGEEAFRRMFDEYLHQGA